MKIQLLAEMFDHARQLLVGAIEEGGEQPPHRALGEEGRHQKITPVLGRPRQRFQVVERLGLASELQLVLGQFESVLQQAENRAECGPDCPAPCPQRPCNRASFCR